MVALPIYPPTTMAQGFTCSAFLQGTSYLLSEITATLVGVRQCATVILLPFAHFSMGSCVYSRFPWQPLSSKLIGPCFAPTKVLFAECLKFGPWACRSVPSARQFWQGPNKPSPRPGMQPRHLGLQQGKDLLKVS